MHSDAGERFALPDAGERFALPDAAQGYPLPDAVARWATDATGSQLVTATELLGGLSSTVASLTFADGAELVLRLHTQDDWLAREPDLATREAVALRALAGTDMVAPLLVAVDEFGEFCGRPALLMTRLPGEPDLSDASPARLDALAAALSPLHALSAPAGLPGFQASLAAAARVAPTWTQAPEVWRAAISVCAGPAPSGGMGFIHRDYHPGNVLVDGGRISGVVDWVNACAGPPEIDVAHCRVNLALVHGVDAADRFAEAATTDRRRQAYYDLLDCLDLFAEDLLAPGSSGTGANCLVDSFRAMGAPPMTVELLRRRTDEYLDDALRRWKLS
jgi:aminoglycoside phosphotransferase (APT) family kinase protein